MLVELVPMVRHMDLVVVVVPVLLDSQEQQLAAAPVVAVEQH